MTDCSSLIFSLAVVAVAIGGISWTVGYEKLGKRAIAFGVVLALVGQALVAHAGLLGEWLRQQAGSIVLGMIVLVAILMLGCRLRSSRGCRHDDERLARKKRVGRGP